MNKKISILIILFLFTCSSLFSQDYEVELLEGKGLFLKCDSLSEKIQWQESDDNIYWTDIADETSYELTVIPEGNKYYRAKLGKTICDNVSATTYVITQQRPGKIIDFDSSFEKYKELKSCTYLSAYDKYDVYYYVMYNYTWSWGCDDDEAVGMIMSNNNNFEPNDGQSYSIEDQYVVYTGQPNGSYNFVSSLLDGSYYNYKRYLFTYNEDYVYSTCFEVDIYEISSYIASKLSDSCSY